MPELDQVARGDARTLDLVDGGAPTVASAGEQRHDRHVDRTPSSASSTRRCGATTTMPSTGLAAEVRDACRNGAEVLGVDVRRADPVACGPAAASSAAMLVDGP